jgi:Fic family protein
MDKMAVEKWRLNPVWPDINSPTWTTPMPTTLDDAVQKAWKKCFSGNVTLISVALKNSVAAHSLLAAQFYRHLRHHEAAAEQWPLMALVLAEIHFLLNDSKGALTLLTMAQVCIGGIGVDAQLDSAVMYMEQIVVLDGIEVDEIADAYLEVTRYRRVKIEITASQSVDWNSVVQQWKQLTTSAKNPKLAVESMSRFICVTTNEIEGVFSLDGSSLSMLVKRGFFVNSIAGFSRNSKITKKAKVINILKNTKSCFTSLRFKPSEFDDGMIKSIHARMLHDDNLELTETDDGSFYCLIPLGTYRHCGCYAVHDDSSREVHYCPPADLDAEMDWFYENARLLLSREDLDPFYVSAWIQWAFLFIHPFADGNGRVARMISSIPLLKKGLPPVVVTQERKSLYFNALFCADRNGDLRPLAEFLKEEAQNAVAYLNTLQTEVIDSSFSNDSLDSGVSESSELSDLIDNLAATNLE